MFFFHFENTAAAEFRTVAAAHGLTHEQIAKRLGVTRGAVSQFLGGRPLSENLLRKIMDVFPGEEGKRILIGHLNDQLKRMGISSDTLLVMAPTRHSYLLEQAAKLLAENPSHVVDLVNVIDSWQKPATVRRKRG